MQGRHTPLLLVMIFICTVHLRYSDILDQFHSRYKDLEAATIESVVDDVTYHDGFRIVDPRKNSHQGGPKVSNVATDKAGKTWTNTFEWLSSFLSRPSRLTGTVPLPVRPSVPFVTALKSHGMCQPIVLC